MSTLKEERDGFAKRTFSILYSSPRLRMQIAETSNGILKEGILKLSKKELGVKEFPKLYIESKTTTFPPSKGHHFSIFVRYTNEEGNLKIKEKNFLINSNTNSENTFTVSAFSKKQQLGYINMNQVYSDLKEIANLSEGISLVYCTIQDGELNQLISAKQNSFKSSETLMIYNNGEIITSIKFKGEN